MNYLSTYLRYGFYGLLMGFGLSRMGFSDFAEAHAMFTFEDLRLFLSFGGGVTLITIFFFLIRAKNMPGKDLNRGAIIGGVLFGVGWAVTGACPSVVLVQIGEGQLAAFATLVGVVVGNTVYPSIHRRFFGWDMGTCGL